MMRRFALCMAYYDNPMMLTRQLTYLETVHQQLRQQIEVCICDDGSQRWPAEIHKVKDVPVSLYRIDVDVRWNQDAARNICAHNTKADWLLLTDIDHIVPERTWRDIIESKLDSRVVYRFSRQTMERDEPKVVLTDYKPHPNSWLMTRSMWNRVGGYDERFAGHYGTDAEFRDRLMVACAGAIVQRKSVLWRVPRSTIPDASTTTYTRKGDPIDAGAIPKIKALRDREAGWRPLNFRFPYRLVSQL